MAKQTPEKVSSYEPLGSRVVVKRLADNTVSDGGILIPESAREDRRLAEVIAVGPGRVTEHGVLIEPRVKAGDIVLTVKHKGVELDHGEDGLLLIMDESDCMVKVTL